MFDPRLRGLPVDHWPLDRAVAAGEVALECRGCRKFARLLPEQLEGRVAPDTPLGEIGAKARCRRCGARGAYVLVRLNGVRGDRAWVPEPPRMRRD